MRVTRQRLAALYAVVGLVMVSLGGGIYTHAAFSDSETSEVTIQAASDFTVTAGNFDTDPGQISRSSDGGTFHVDFTIDEPGRVETDRFSLRVVETSETFDATGGRCSKEKGQRVTCRVKFDRGELVAHTDDPGTYDLVLSGWWDRGRDFEVTGSVEITENGKSCRGQAGNTGCEAATAGTAGNQRQCTSSSANSGCGSSSEQLIGPPTPRPAAAATRE